MSQRIPEETIQDILHRADIVDVISDYVQLTQRGVNAKGLCPFHDEKTPSFTANPAKGIFYCFGCQAGGNVIGFLMQHDNLTFPEAVRLLADRYGVRIPELVASPQQSALHQLYQLHQAAATFFQQCLLRHPDAQLVRTYCRERQLTGEVAIRFGVGYAPDAWEALSRQMQQQGFTQELLVRSGLAIARDNQRGMYDRFRHRLIFPIYDRQGRPVAFGGRYLEGGEASHVPKYLNSPETPIFHKSRTLYGFHLAKQSIRQQGCAILVEGYTDAIACHRQGVTHVAGTLGTALTESHVEMLKGLTKDVVLIFDADTAGGAATERSIGLFLDAGMRVRIVELPEGEDPDSFLRQHTGTDFLHRVSEAQNFLAYLVARAKRLHDLQTPTGQADCVGRILPLLRKIDNHVERWGYVALLAEKLSIPPDVLQRELPVQSRRGGERPSRREAAPPALQSSSSPAPWPREEYLLIQELCHDLRLLAQVQRHITSDAFQDADLRAIFMLLVRLAPQWQGTAFPQILHEIEPPTQQQIVSKMALESFDASVHERAQAVDDCLTKMQRRNMKARRQRVIDQLHTASDEAERELLQEFQRLKQEEESGAPAR